MSGIIAEKSSLFYARVVGYGLLLMAIVAIFANFFVIENLIIPGDGAATVTNILADDVLFRFGIAGFMIVLILDVFVAWGLYMLLHQVNKSLALLAASFEGRVSS